MLRGLILYNATLSISSRVLAFYLTRRVRVFLEFSESLFVLETILRLMGRRIILLHRILGYITEAEVVFEEILLMEQPLLKRCTNIAQSGFVCIFHSFV